MPASSLAHSELADPQELLCELTLRRAREYHITSLERCASREVLDDGRDVENHGFCPRFLEAFAIQARLDEEVARVQLRRSH